MIISRTPLRMSFVGGGSDIKSYYQHNGGAVISVTLDQYIYINVHKSFFDTVRIAYSRVEEENSFSDVKHPLVRATAQLLSLKSGVEVTSIADIPAKGSGLGSSSSFTVGLLNALGAYKGTYFSKRELAELACEVELQMCNQPIGKQDQFAAAFGGWNEIKFHSCGRVDVSPLNVPELNEHRFRSWLMVFYTGVTRSASEVLREQKANMSSKETKQALDDMVELVPKFRDALMQGDMEELGSLLNTNWHLKRTLASGVSNDSIDKIYNAAVRNGAIGGKLLGAGTGGFMIFVVPPERQLALSLSLHPLKQMFWGFEKIGSSLILQT